MNIIKRTNYPVLFDEFFNDFFNVQTMNIPPHNVMESENDFQIEFSVPGSNKKDFEIELEKDNLKISKKKEVSNSSNHYSKQEFSYDFFQKSFYLPDSIDHFLSEVVSSGLNKAMDLSCVPAPSREFMKHTFELIEQGKGHEIAASFSIGRESIVPVMFKRILELTKIGVSDAPVFHYYLERHAHLDGEHHGPMALKLLDDLCANEPEKENEVIKQVQSSLNARIKLWDGVILATESSGLLSH